MTENELHNLKLKYLNKLVFVVIQDEFHPIAAKGRVEYIDDAGQLHGTWGSLAAIPGVDRIELL